MDMNNSNDNHEYIIEQIESYQDDIIKIDEKVKSNQEKIVLVKLAEGVNIILGIISLLIKFPKVFNDEVYLNIVCFGISLVGLFYFYVKKLSLKLSSDLLNMMKSHKLMLINTVQSLLLEIDNEISMDKDDNGDSLKKYEYSN